MTNRILCDFGRASGNRCMMTAQKQMFYKGFSYYYCENHCKEIEAEVRRTHATDDTIPIRVEAL